MFPADLAELRREMLEIKNPGGIGLLKQREICNIL
jgi:hypothetical protein